MTPNEYEWQHCKGRDADGDTFNTAVLVHGTGKILSRISIPRADEYYYRAYFYVPKSVFDAADEGFDFISLDSAKTFVEGIVSAWNQDDATKIVNVGRKNDNPHRPADPPKHAARSGLRPFLDRLRNRARLALASLR
jgi:hypothetical protein